MFVSLAASVAPRQRSDLLCVEWDVKPYTLTHPASIAELAQGEKWRRLLNQSITQVI